jgi:hypothetical protein
MSEGISKKYKSNFNKRSLGFFNDVVKNPTTPSTAPIVDKNLTDLEKKINKTITKPKNGTNTT